ncbi:ankyrin repeat, SAM and basic leucine zipper domain-containing protein 1 [Spea bombifrons]|uniref:ankyrin repeat, SAM and basic leucine zipper domain-containing protein 1 n=1 Tax=Spea bombifrons TaxID=233779 RepID=UPI002349FCA7|nr:ankyrin repeat, SAM and basic leucine zipper domain-containing protein 1 [Spea bombifrons]
MAALRYHVVPGGGESSDSDDGWDMGDFREANPLVESREETLKKALTAGNVKLVEELLDSGLSVECCFRFGWTPLMFAASVANLEMVRVLLDKGANASFERDKFTVLMSACAAYAPEESIMKCVELLLSRNADPNVACRKQMTPLMFAAREGHSQVVALLFARGADINAQDENGYTGLSWAAHGGRKSTVLKMLELGADKNLATKNGNTAADIAKTHNHLEIFSILSFSANMNQGKHNLSKEESIYRYLKTQPEAVTNCTNNYSASSDLEVFLHGLGLEHLTDLFKANDLTLRQFLTLEEDEFKKAGIVDLADYEKIIAAVKEIQVEETKIEESPNILKMESSGDELFTFLLKLNRQCSCLTHMVQSINDQIPLNPHKIVLEWDSTQNISAICGDLVSSVADLNKEVCRLQSLLQKFEQGQKDSCCRVPPLEEQPGWRRCRIAAVAVLSLGFIVSIIKITALWESKV